MPRKFLTKQELAARFRVHPNTIDRWRRHGLLPEIQVEGTIRFDLADIERFEARHRLNAPDRTPEVRRGDRRPRAAAVRAARPRPASDWSDLREQLVDPTTGEIVDVEDVAVLADEAAAVLDVEDAADAGLEPPRGATVGWYRRHDQRVRAARQVEQ